MPVGTVPSRILTWVASSDSATPKCHERIPPELHGDELLVEVEASVFAGPELHCLDLATGRAPGGAAVGLVVATGDAAGDYLGRRVLVGPLSACGECDSCLRGRLMSCASKSLLGIDADGTLASHVVTRRRWTCALDGPLLGVAPGPEAAILAREATLAYTMVAKAGVGPSETTLWLGEGVLSSLGREIAASKGASIACATAEEMALPDEELVASVKARLRSAGNMGPWKVFETSGRDAARARALTLALQWGQLFLVAGSAVGTVDDFQASLAFALDQELSFISVAAPMPDLSPETCALVARGELDIASKVRCHPVEALETLHVELRAGRHRDKLAVVTMR